MQQSEQLKGDLRIRLFEDGRIILDLPNDPMIACFMLHLGQDELQERMMGRKSEHARKQHLITKPKDDAMPNHDWGT
jgi:hypothetical protein